MEKYLQNHLWFLHSSRGSGTNTKAQQFMRSYKRKQVQAIMFRIFESIEYFCQCMSRSVLMRLEKTANIFDRVSGIF